jgi:hypothetical protein
MLKRGCVVLLVTLASACSGSTPTTAPTPAPTATVSPAPAPTPTPPTPTVSLTGQVTDGTTSAPISGATVVFSYPVMYATTDSLGNYTFTGVPAPALSSALVWASDRRPGAAAALTDNYEPAFCYYRSTSQNLHLYRVKRIAAGDSTVVTVAPDDTLCVNNVQDFPGLGQDYVCRRVRVMVPSDGVMTLEAVSAQGGARPPLEVETIGGGPERFGTPLLGNPTSIQVTVGTEVVVNVEMLLGSTTSQSFTLNTSMSRQ